MKLAVLTTHPIQYNAPLFKLLAERGKIEIKVFYSWGKAVLKDKFDPGFAQVIKWDIPLLEGYPFQFLENVSKAPGSHHRHGIDNPGLVKEIEAFGADAILIYGWNFISHLKALRYFRKRIPVLFRGDSILNSETGGIKETIKKLLLTRVYKNADVALFAGTENKKYFELYGFKPPALKYMPHAVDNERFAKGDGAQIREEFDIPTDATVFLFAGKLEKKKDPAILLRAFAAVTTGDEYLVIAGSGELEFHLRKKYGTHVNVRFLPFQNQLVMPDLYASCDVFVLPSLGPGETWGLAVNEAMAAGKAVIVSDKCGCAPDVVTNEENGYIFPAGNQIALENYLRNFIAHKDVYRKAGALSAEKIKAFNFETAAVAVETALKELLTR